MSDVEVITVVISDPPAEDPVNVVIGDADIPAAVALIENHRLASAPHPAYDNMASLTLLFENGLF
ncbi:hypothetical protein [uncultured Gordonia sp.]|uniref:hypothetical protein n=1 Tax=uncultured Gordonia sp. TaxID=198437 RepID=UPI00262B86A9|nr:hypothetical protein [uncultured Gordonia sp.]